MNEIRSFLVQWQNAQAEYWVGEMPGSSVGSHMRGLVKGDRIFVCSCDNSEIYLLGAIRVFRVGTERSGPFRGKPSAVGKHVSGPFQMLPLRGLKWRIRFEETDFPQLSRTKSLIWQVRSRRRLAPASAELLLAALEDGARQTSMIERQFAKEGGPLLRQVTSRERDPRVRAAALRMYDFTCAVCERKPAEVYGQFAKQCLDVHHLLPLAADKENRSATKLSDVVLLCRLSRALHMYENPGAWLKFKRHCNFLARRVHVTHSAG